MQNKPYKLTIFFGDVDESTAMIAKDFDPSAWLLDHSNYKEFLAQDLDKDTVIYTSQGDLPKDLNTVYSILLRADSVIYCPPATWSKNQQVDVANPGQTIQGLTEVLLSMLPDHVKVQNFWPSLTDAIPLVDHRKCAGPQLWNVGCSISHGVGVSEQEKYGQLLSNELSMACSFLTRRGSAIDWAADQILRSDIRANDIVIWGLTSPERITYVHDNKLLKGVTMTSYSLVPEYKNIVDPSNLYSQNTIYKHIYAIKQVINYCNKINAHLVLVELSTGNQSLQRILKLLTDYVKVGYEYNFDNSVITVKFLDLGTDNQHPGPQQHIKYKEIILDKLNQLKII